MSGSLFTCRAHNPLCSGLPLPAERISYWLSDHRLARRLTSPLFDTLKNVNADLFHLGLTTHLGWTINCSALKGLLKRFWLRRWVYRVHTLEHCLIPSFVWHFLQNAQDHARRNIFTSLREGEGPYGVDVIELDMVLIDDDALSILTPGKLERKLMPNSDSLSLSQNGR